MMSVVKGRLLGLGVGPGDPELITLKALRLLRAAPVVGYFVAKGKKGNAFGIIEAHLDQAQVRLPLVYPVTTEKLEPPLCYETIISDFYDTAAEQLAAHLDAGRDVAVICEGDPFFYGSYMYLHDRLAMRYESEVVPGVCSMLGGAAVLGAPLVYRNQSLSVLSGVLPEEELRRRLADADAAVVMKLGRNFDKVRRVLVELGLERRALYVERATMANQRIVPLERVEPMASPYFSLIVVPGDKWQGGVGGE
ncbi:precorrin-2 C(20)-methyltransferase [Pseudomonas aeruginosa]|uniref:precorrin-2 C(20)-methyltransferase n=1 Tax=Pseudomonas aeruginosa TaxID=287 RepID=UPI0010682566|nr:precorrin-2 C(20)-methyltransferase [Pseudomonas aeruginosa]TEI00733.1 precorrin-2 C(20)-methyltransferase [Pseudomonas aeruginosa]HBO1601807.1 precorrin-2 C(20)-methyltransferase [Pseudomonas aeruginosa]HBO1976077.1 precorrin-2 C(20)-methyltransferase [Pseudomonas aeruginosa]HBO2037410.1 precorrin-2 C(20)-methyltransferase [Pseudomonas aeruginosa]HEJ5104190.1 precorrin-2 C(20)-methyltransferase [Pseudomonas aeruginosa]